MITSSSRRRTSSRTPSYIDWRGVLSKRVSPGVGLLHFPSMFGRRPDPLRALGDICANLALERFHILIAHLDCTRLIPAALCLVAELAGLRVPETENRDGLRPVSGLDLDAIALFNADEPGDHSAFQYSRALQLPRLSRASSEPSG